MSIGAFATAEASLAEQPKGAAEKKAPPGRRTVAVADTVSQPEPR
jgi:hypothetical protein